MTTKVFIAVAATIILAGGLGGCASAVSSENDVAPAVSAPPAPAPADSTADGDASTDADVTSQPGAYLEYYDGAIEQTPGTKVLFFHASWCPKCRALESDILAQQIPDDFTIFKVDFDTATALRQTYGVTLQTTIVYVDDAGAALAKGVLYDETTLDAIVAAAP